MQLSMYTEAAAAMHPEAANTGLCDAFPFLLGGLGMRPKYKLQLRLLSSRTHGETGEPVAVQIPHHLDITAQMANGAQAHFVMSDVTGMFGSRPAGCSEQM